MASCSLLIRSSDGRHEHATSLQNCERPILGVSADRIEHDVDVGQGVLEALLLQIDDAVGTEGLNVGNMVRG